MQDLNYCTKFGRLYYYRKIKGNTQNSLFLFLLKNMTFFSGYCLYLHKTNNVKFNLSKYILTLNGPYKNTNFFKFLPDEISALNIFEFVFILGLIIKLLDIFLKFWTLSDRRLSILNVDSDKYKLIPKLSGVQKVFFRLGINKYNISSMLKSTLQLIFGYFILCQLELTSFLTIESFFTSIDYYLDYSIRLGGFENIEEQKSGLTKLILNFTDSIFSFIDNLKVKLK